MQKTILVSQCQQIEAVTREVIPAAAPTMTLCSYGNKINREELARVRTSAGTTTHKPICAYCSGEKLIEALGFLSLQLLKSHKGDPHEEST